MQVANNIHRQLSRLPITGNIHEHVPMCVIIEILDAHGIKYSREDCDDPNFIHHALSRIREASVAVITTEEIVEKIQWQYVARFVNKYCQWTQGILVQAYNFLLQFMDNTDPLTKIPEFFVSGSQTPNNPYAINACILYKICSYHRLNTTVKTTINQMTYAVKMLREPIDSVLRRSEAFVQNNARRTDLINILMLSQYEVQDPEPIIIDDPINDYNKLPRTDITHDILTTLYQSLINIRELQNRITPSSPEGAIAMAAVNFHIDISKSVNPMREYKLLQVARRSNYQPMDPWMKYWYKNNPTIFDLEMTFQPLFPIGYYNEPQLMSMVRNEGFTNNEIQHGDSYELLQIAYVSDTFYQGPLPNMKSNTTSIELIDFNDIPYGQLLCFGQYDFPLDIISMSELIEVFNNNQNFTSPFAPDAVFPPVAINKLKIIAQSHIGPNPNIRLSGETIQIRAMLLRTINEIEFILQNNDSASRQLALTYRNADPKTKLDIIMALNTLLKLGMYMRGWMGIEEYPVAKSIVTVEQEPRVAMNVTDAMGRYESQCRSLGRIGMQINNLPLVLYKAAEYQVSNSENDGLTIGQRLNIVKQGNRTDNMASCIRLSSNWICSSAHKYLMGLGQPSPFDIFHLRHIS